MCGPCMNWDNVTTGMGCQYTHRCSVRPPRSGLYASFSTLPAQRRFPARETGFHPSPRSFSSGAANAGEVTHNIFPRLSFALLNCPVSKGAAERWLFQNLNYKVMHRDCITPGICVDDKRLAGECGGDCSSSRAILDGSLGQKNNTKLCVACTPSILPTLEAKTQAADNREFRPYRTNMEWGEVLPTKTKAKQDWRDV